MTSAQMHSNDEMTAAVADPGDVYPALYVDEQDCLLYRVHRTPAKDFWQDRPDGHGAWVKNLNGIRRVPYRLPDLLEAADAGDTVFVVEGEKDVETLRLHGLTATTSAGGWGWRWPPDWAEYFRGFQRAIVIADNDEGGLKAAAVRAELIRPVVSDVRLIERMPGVGDHGDVSDFLSTMGTLEDLLRIVEESDQVSPPSLLSVDSESDSGGKRSPAPSAADDLLAFIDELRQKEALELFHDQAGEPYATLGLPAFPFVQTFPLTARQFERLILGAHFAQRAARNGKRKAVSAATWKDVRSTLEAIACYEGAQYSVELRVAGLPDRVIIDLGDTTGRAVVVTARGWTIEDDIPVRFRRPRWMQPLPTPTPGGDIELFRRHFRVSDEGLAALLAWMISALSGLGPFPVLNLNGEQGSGKSSIARGCRRLVDPSQSDLRSLPSDERNLAVALHNSYVLAFDNLSGIRNELSDALCRVASGEGFAIRTLYEDNDEQVFSGARPMIFNGISEAASRPDLLDRSLIVEVPLLPDELRVDEPTLLAAFERDRSAMLGVLLDGLVSGLAHRDSVSLERSPRMVGAARLSVAAETGLGLPAGTMERAWVIAKESATSVALDASPVAQEVQAFYRKEGPFEGTWGQLLARLTAQRGDRPGRNWPTTPRGLSAEIRRIAPDLRSAGLVVEFPDRQGHQRNRLVRIGHPPSPEFDLPL